MRIALLALAAGLLLLRFLPQLPGGGWLAAMVCLALAMLPTRLYPLSFFLIGVSWASFSASLALDDRLSPELDGQTLWLEGRVVGLPEAGEGVVRFQLEDAVSRRAQLPHRLRLAWYGGPQVHAGEQWRLAVRLKRPHGGVNPQSFDYEAWLLAQRIGATGTIKQGERLAPAAGAGSWRDGLRQRLLAVPAHRREGGLAALVLGDGSGLSTRDWTLLQDTGTVHLMVISGQHIALLAGFVYALVAGLARFGCWPRHWPWLPAACCLALLAALGYGFLAGFGVPVRRACIMLGLVLLWRWRFRHLGVSLPFLLALDLVLLAEPLVVLQAGFWLSFGAVAVLVWVFAGRLGSWSWLRSWGRAQWTMAIGLLPMLMSLGLPVSPSGPVANLLAVPWVGLLVVPLALLGTLLLPVPWLGEALLWSAGGMLELLFMVLAALADRAPAWLAPEIAPLWWWLGALGCVLVLLPGGLPLRLPGAVLLLALFFAPCELPGSGRVEVWMLDVGQGQAFLLRTRRHALLYDAGPRLAGFDSGERIVLPSLRRLGVDRLDLMLLSHADNDHAGGALAIWKALPVAAVSSGEAAALPAVLGARSCRHGEQWVWDEVRFTVWRWGGARDSNQASCVLMVEANGERLLLTGDIDVRAEMALIAEGLDLRADWLVAPHHGSRTSSSSALLDAVQPRAVLISRGRHNAFNHPHPLVLARYRERSLQVFDSAEQGAVTLLLGDFSTAQGLREKPRFWREK